MRPNAFFTEQLARSRATVPVLYISISSVTRSRATISRSRAHNFKTEVPTEVSLLYGAFIQVLLVEPARKEDEEKEEEGKKSRGRKREER